MLPWAGACHARPFIATTNQPIKPRAGDATAVNPNTSRFAVTRARDSHRTPVEGPGPIRAQWPRGPDGQSRGHPFSALRASDPSVPRSQQLEWGNRAMNGGSRTRAGAMENISRDRTPVRGTPPNSTPGARTNERVRRARPLADRSAPGRTRNPAAIPSVHPAGHAGFAEGVLPLQTTHPDSNIDTQIILFHQHIPLKMKIVARIGEHLITDST